MRVMLKRWGVRYRSYAQLRFDLFSKRGGDWQELAASTIKQRRSGKKLSASQKLKAVYESTKPKADSQATSGGGLPSILRDKGLLFAVLAPIFAGAPGAIEDSVENGIRVGYGGGERHPDKNGRLGQASIAQIAEYHNSGYLPRLPQRIIIADPSPEVIGEMIGDADKAMADVARGLF